MRRYVPLLAVIAACASAPRQPPAGPEPPHPDVTVSEDGAARPRPKFEIQHNWVIVPTDGVDQETLAVVTLHRAEMMGTMRLEILKSHGRSPSEIAAGIRAMIDEVGELRTGDPPGDPAYQDRATEDGFMWYDTQVRPGDDPYIGKVLVRRIPGRTDVVAYCEGWWPKTSHEFLPSQLHAACRSVRPHIGL